MWLCKIIKKFKDITRMQNMIGCIDGCHIPLYEQFDKRKNTWNKDFFNQKHFHFLLLQVVCDSNKLFWNVYCE